MVNLFSIEATLLGLAVSAIAAPTPVDTARLARRSAINSDAIIGFPQTVPSGSPGALYLKYLPFLYTANGCVPFPAVDAHGNTNSGLAPTGPPNGQCSSSPGQIYARSTAYNGQFAIMYAWYWPKDEPIQGIGHRHDWESTVVWLNSAQTQLLGIATSDHGGFAVNKSPSLSGTSPLVEYISYFPLDHQLASTSTVGVKQPLIAWESLPAVAQQALATTDFGEPNVPFKDPNFMDNLAEAEL